MSEKDLLQLLDVESNTKFNQTLAECSIAETISILVPQLFNPTFHHVASQYLLDTVIGTTPSATTIQDLTNMLDTFILSLTSNHVFAVSGIVLGLMLQQLVNPTNVTMATRVSNALVHLCSIRLEVSKDIILALQQVAIPTDAIVFVRYYTFLCQIVVQDWDVKVEALFEPFFKALQNDNDPLLQMNLLDIIDTYVKSDAILISMHLEPILLKMIGCSSSSDQWDMDTHPFCAGQALTLLSRYDDSHLNTEVFVKVLVSFGRKLSGEIEKIGFIDGITTFASTDKRLQAVMDNQEVMEEWLNVRSGQTKLKVVVMTSVARVLGQRALSDDLLVRLYNSLGKWNDLGSGDDTTQMIMGYAKSQIVEIRIAAYDLLRAFARTHKGAHVLVKYGGFIEFLCNYNAEIVKEGKEMKYELVKAVFDSDVKGLLDYKVVKMLEEVIANGAYYYKPVRNVMLE